jgi:hypothetical protein
MESIMFLPNHHLLFISSGSTEITEVWEQLKERFNCSFIELNKGFSNIHQKKQLQPLLSIASKVLVSPKS